MHGTSARDTKKDGNPGGILVGSLWIFSDAMEGLFIYIYIYIIYIYSIYIYIYHSWKGYTSNVTQI